MKIKTGKKKKNRQINKYPFKTLVDYIYHIIFMLMFYVPDGRKIVFYNAKFPPPFIIIF